MDYRLADLTRQHAADRPDKVALVLGDGEVTYGELDASATRVATALAAAGVGEGDRVAVWDLNGLAFFPLLFGAAKLGAVVAPVNFRLAPPEVAQILADAGSRILFVGSPLLDVLEAMDRPAALETVVVLDGPATGDRVAWDDWLATGGDTDPGFTGDDDTVVLQLYTSGTTGLPKGVMLANRNLGTLAEPLREAWGVDADTVSLVAMPLYHIGGSGWTLVGLRNGARNVVVREIDPVGLLDTMESERVTHGFVVPALLGMLSQVPGAADRDWSHLDNLAYGASPITAPVLEAALATFGCPMFQVYGLTETTGAVVQLDAEDHDPGGPRAHLLASAGKPYDFNDVAIRDPDDGHDLGPGETGQIWMRSGANMVGYWGRPDQTAEVLVDGWLRTGDAGYRDDEGYLFITDRITDMIVSGAENVYPIEVEQVLARHPAVRDVAVIGCPTSAGARRSRPSWSPTPTWASRTCWTSPTDDWPATSARPASSSSTNCHAAPPASC